MEANTLVTSTKAAFEGIGCVAKKLKASVQVNHGTSAVITCKPEHLLPVDVSGCKTITFSELQILSATNSKNLPGHVIIGNEVKQWVGIGWVSVGVVTADDLKKYPRVI